MGWQRWPITPVKYVTMLHLTTPSALIAQGFQEGHRVLKEYHAPAKSLGKEKTLAILKCQREWEEQHLISCHQETEIGGRRFYTKITAPEASHISAVM